MIPTSFRNPAHTIEYTHTHTRPSKDTTLFIYTCTDYSCPVFPAVPLLHPDSVIDNS